MGMAGDGPWAITVMWICTILTFAFVVLRWYTRVKVVQNYGIDDHVYNFAFLLLLVYTIMTTMAAHYGFGQNMAEILDMDDLARAILCEAIGQTFAVVGMAVAKWSLGLFLLRLVTETWHKVAIWITMSCLMGASISVCFVFWLQCSPPAYLYDRRIPGGYCYINTAPVSFTLCVLCVIADFFFAIFPWMFLWKLNMNQREKIIIAASMSLGLIAGACGIKRTIEVPGLVSQNYLKDTVGLIVWSAAEIAVTMICIGIPVCRPLYKSFLNRLASSLGGGGVGGASGGYQKHDGDGGVAGSHASGLRGLGSGTGGGGNIGLRTIGGSEMPRRGPASNNYNNNKQEQEQRSGAAGWESDDGKGCETESVGESDAGRDGNASAKRNGNGFKDVKLGINGPFSKAKVVGGVGGRVVGPENGSDEEILGSEYKRSSQRKSPPGSGKVQGGEEGGDVEMGLGRERAKDIHVTESWRVTRS